MILNRFLKPRPDQVADHRMVFHAFAETLGRFLQSRQPAARIRAVDG